MAKIELDQVQSNVLRGYRHDEALGTVHYDFLEFQTKADAHKVVAMLRPLVTSCTAWNGGAEFTLNLAFTHRGLDKLDAPGRSMFPAAFRSGMTPRATEVLGDEAESAPENWDEPFRDALKIDAVVCITSADQAGLARGVAAVEAALEKAPGVKRVGTETAAGLPDYPKGTEHFGFVDGIGQPEVAGAGLPHVPGEGTPVGKGWEPIPAGEFVLGYENASGLNPFPDAPFRNGSFMVFRKLHERVAAFRSYVAQLATAHELDPELVAAKMVGRWRSGTPLVSSAHEDDPAIARARDRNNDFRYGDDPHGHRCPFGAHIRRANPREDPSGPGILQVRMHRIIRRALPYGDWLPDGAKDDGKPRGVLFVVINASIETQFEYVQANWMNDVISSNYTTYAEDRDPIIGNNAGKGKLLIPDQTRPVIAWDLPRFVVTKGGEYFFLPSLSTLDALAAP